MHRLRPAVPADAAALAALAEATFRATFAAANTPADMDTHCRASYSAAIQARELADPAMATWLVEQAGQLIAFAQLRWGPAPACVEGRAAAEVQRLYVDRPWHGTGIAHALMAACLDTLRARGAETVWLGVWEHNPRAIAFYRKAGFLAVGEHVFRLGSDPQRDLIMARHTGD